MIEIILIALFVTAVAATFVFSRKASSATKEIEILNKEIEMQKSSAEKEKDANI